MNMKRDQRLITLAMCLTLMIISFTDVRAQKQNAFILEHENDIAKNEPSPHNGNGMTTVYNYFSGGDTASNLVFRKRVLHPGSEIGYHLQEKEEIYYILSGEGELKVNDVTYKSLDEIELSLQLNPSKFTVWFHIAFPKLKEWLQTSSVQKH